MEFNDRLKVLRETNGLTQAEIAQYVGVSRPTISGYETRGYQPSHEKLNKLAEIFSVSIDYLLNGGPQDNELLQRHNERNKQLRITLSQRCSALSLVNKSKVLDYIRYLEYLENLENK